MRIPKRVLSVLVLLIVVAAMGAAGPQKEKAAAAAVQYTFYYVSHIGPADPNMKWLTISSEHFMQKFPEVRIVYVADDEFSVMKQVENLKRAVAARPDGLIVPITDARALEPVLRDAIENKGIPVIAANIPDFRPVGERIPYLTYVGADEFLTGLYLGRHLIQTARAGTVPMPRKAVVPIHHVGHMGLEMRANGMTEALKEIGVPVDKLAIGDNPAEAKSIMNSYLIANRDVNVIFTVASWSAPWAYDVAKDLNLSPDVDTRGVTILTVDASPAALEGILDGKLLSTHSQGFYLQGWMPAEWLYFYNRFGYEPPPEILTGPIVIDKSNAQKFKNTVQAVLGKDVYDGMILWRE